MKSKIIICPAYKTLPTEVWYQWAKKELVKRGYDVDVLEFPNFEKPSEKEWIEAIHDASDGDQVVLIGHSLGCRAILAYINQYRTRVDKSVLIACPQFWDGIIDTRPPLKAYVEGMQEIDFALVKSLIGKAHLFHGTNDHILSMKDIKFLQEKFGEKADVYISETYGHFDVEKIPELLDLFPK